MNATGAVVLDRVPAQPARPARGWGDTAGTGIRHPDTLRVEGRRLALVDDEHFTRSIQLGDNVAGWEGDERYALYIDQAAGEWVLVRLEADGRYRVSTSTNPVACHMSPVDVVGHLLHWLVEHDAARGYDVAADVIAHNERREAALDAAFSDRVLNDLAPRLAHALRRDGVDGWD